ncbi:MAG: sialidase family protein [Actinomycetota bacterium]
MRGRANLRARLAATWAGLQRGARGERLLGRLEPLDLRPFFGVALLLVGSGGWLVGEALAAPPIARAAGLNQPVNVGASDPLDISAHNSPTVAVNPTDPANVAISNRIDTPRFSCALHVSADGGATWSKTTIPRPKGEPDKCYAPDVAFSPDGTMYLSFVTLKGLGNVPNAVWVARSEDGGRTLSTPLRAAGRLSFQVRLATDPAVPDRLFLTWLRAEEVAQLRFVGTGYPIVFARSDDGGESWTRPVAVSDRTRERVVAPSVTPGRDGEPYVLYLDLGEDRLDYEGGHEGIGGPPYSGSFQLVLARSDDGGGTWRESVVEDELTPIERFVVFLPAFPSLAVDREEGTIYVAYHDARLGDADVWMWTSHDGGRSFGDAVRVNDTPHGDGGSQYLPKVAVAPDGRVDVVYYDRRADIGDLFNEVSLQYSVDEGASFTRSLRVSDLRFDSRVGFGSERGMPDLGSRLGLVSTDTASLAAWSDTRAGTEITNKQDLVRALVAFSDRPQVPDYLPGAMSAAGLGLGALGLVLVSVWFAGWLPARRRPAPEGAGDETPDDGEAPPPDGPGTEEPAVRPV